MSSNIWRPYRIHGHDRLWNSFFQDVTSVWTRKYRTCLCLAFNINMYTLFSEYYFTDTDYFWFSVSLFNVWKFPVYLFLSEDWFLFRMNLKPWVREQTTAHKMNYNLVFKHEKRHVCHQIIYKFFVLFLFPFALRSLLNNKLYEGR